MNEHLLLVEGADDKWFFTALLAQHGMNVEVHPPNESDTGIDGNGIDNLLTSLPLLLKQLASRQRKRLAIVIDADKAPQFGFTNRRNQIIDIIRASNLGYNTETSAPESLNGEFFTHDILAPIGLWIMPNHSDSGMLETFLEPCITGATREEIFSVADNALDQLTTNDDLTGTRFSPNHFNKVRFNTWLGWQKKPENCRMLGPACALKNGWLDSEHENIKAITVWLNTAFATNDNN